MSSGPSYSGSNVVNTTHDLWRRADAILMTTVILVPKIKKTSSTKVNVENAVRRIDKRATIASDPKSANFWIVASSAEAAARLLEGANILQQFTTRKVVISPDSKEPGEVSRLRDFIVKNLLLTASDPTSTSCANDLANQITISTSQPHASTRKVYTNPKAVCSSTQPLSSQLPQREEDSKNKAQTSLEPDTAIDPEQATPRDDASVEWVPPSPTTSSTSSESDVFYSANSSFFDDLMLQSAEVPGEAHSVENFKAETTESESSPKLLPVEPSRPSQASNSSSRRLLPPPSRDLVPTSSTSINDRPPVKRVRFSKSVSGGAPSASLPGSSSLSGPFVDGPSPQQIHPSKSLNDLPPEAQEIIIQLFLPVVPRAHEIEPGYTAQAIKSYYAHIHALMNVCSGWKHAMEALSKVWTHIANVMPLSVVETYLARSKGEGVKIVVVAGTGEPGQVDEELCAFRTFMAKVVPHRSRWTSLAVVDFPAGQGNHPLQTVFDVPAPSLKEVYVGTRNNAALSIWKPLSFSGGAPNLRTLCVHGATPDLGDYTFARQLERLHIVDPSWVNTIHLIGVLAINHTIRDLKLVNIKFAIGEERLKQDIDVFDLPNLESFTLSTLNTPAEFGQLFTRLQAPRCREYNISVDLDQLEGSRIESKVGATTIEWNLLGFGLDQFLGTLRDRIARDLVYPEGERQWFDWKEAQDTAPVFEWRSGCFADGVTEGPSFLIRFRTWDGEAVYEWVELVQHQAGELRMMKKRSSADGSRRKGAGAPLAN